MQKRKKISTSKKRSRQKPRQKIPQQVRVSKKPGAINITYRDPKQVLPHLLNLASYFAKKHFQGAEFMAADDDVLGTGAAREIVSGCADSKCWTCTIGDLKLDSQLFQECVFSGIEAKGYHKDRGSIPASQDTQLYTVVIAIQDAKRKDA